MKSTHVMLLVPMLATVVFCQDGPFYGPATGFVHDSVLRAVRPVLGVPGAARLGPPAIAKIDGACVAPNGALAITVAEGEITFWRALGQSSREGVPIGQHTAARIAWSPDSTAAALYFPEEQRLEVLRTTRDGFESVVVVPLNDASTVTALAVAPFARKVAIAGTNGSDTFLTLISQNGKTAVISDVSVLAAAFAPTDSRLFIAQGTGSVSWIGADDSIGGALPLDSPSDSQPAALAVSGTRVYIAYTGSNILRTYDFHEGTIVDLQLETAPTDLLLLPNRNLLVVTERSSTSEPLFIVQMQSEPSVYFVPAGEQSAAGEQQ